MDRPSPDRRTSPIIGVAPIAGTLALGLGMGIAITGDAAGGAVITAGSALVLAGSYWLRRGSKSDEPLETYPASPELIDAETGLPNAAQLDELLSREIARSVRYGDRSAVAVFDVRIIGYRPDTEPGAMPPSPARYISATMLQAARSSDIVARIDTTRFAVVLTECDDDGARLFNERLRTRLGTMPFAHTPDGRGIYVHAWAGMARWEPDYTSPQHYLGAALANLEYTRKGYEAAQTYFRGATAS